MDADRAAADLLAVQHEVVGLGPRPARVASPAAAVLVARRREGMVHRVPALLLLVPLDQREVDRPRRRRRGRRGSARGAAPGPRGGARAPSRRPAARVGHQQQQVARRARRAGRGARSWSALQMNLATGDCSAVRRHLDPDQPLGAGLLGPRRRGRRAPCGSSPPAPGTRERLDRAAPRHDLGEDLELAAREQRRDSRPAPARSAGRACRSRSAPSPRPR